MNAPSAGARDEIVELLAEVREHTRTQAQFLQLLLRSRIWLLMSSDWDGRSIPDASTRLLLVSDPGNDTAQNIAVFSTQARAQAFQTHAPEFRPVEVDAFIAFLGLRDGQGMVVNPRDALAFRLPPKAARQVRDGAYQVLRAMKVEKTGEQP